METITLEKAIEEFNNGGEVWVHTGDFIDMPMFEYERDEDGEELEGDEHRLMHPKSLDMGDDVTALDGYANHYLPE